LVSTDWQLFGFADRRGRLLDLPLGADDEVVMDGQVWAVNGRPWRVIDPLAGFHHVQARLRVVE
jgi:hypothetical protein